MFNIRQPSLNAWRGLGTLVVLLCMVVSTGFRTGSPGKDYPYKHPRPFSGTYQLSATLVSTQLPAIYLHVSGTGVATHLGKSRVESETTVYIEPKPILFSGTTTFTAANGDQLYASFTGLSHSNGDGTETLVRDYTVTGGTGRFSEASGSFTGTSVITTPITPDVAPEINDITFEGSINY